MSKNKFLKIGLMAFIFVFGLFISGVAAEEECWNCPGGGPTLSGDHIYPWWWVCTEDPNMEYDRENSAVEINRNNNATIYIIGNNAPYTWTVTGTGFSLSNAITTGLSNTLNADGTACGTATITVTGCDGNEVKGYVRCTTGVWVYCSPAGIEYTNSPGGGCVGSPYICTNGKFRYRWRYDFGGPASGCSSGDSCYQTVSCDGTTVSWASIASGAGDCNFEGDYCYVAYYTPAYLYFQYWKCP